MSRIVFHIDVNSAFLSWSAVDMLKKGTRHFAKRQLTWFRKNKQTIWLNAEDGNEKNIERILEEI